MRRFDSHRQLKRHLEKLDQPVDRDGIKDLPIYSIPLIMSDADRHQIAWRHPELPVVRLENGEFYRSPFNIGTLTADGDDEGEDHGDGQQ